MLHFSYKEFKNPRYAPRECAGAISARYDFAEAPAQEEPMPIIVPHELISPFREG